MFGSVVSAFITASVTVIIFLLTNILKSKKANDTFKHTIDIKILEVDNKINIISIKLDNVLDKISDVEDYKEDIEDLKRKVEVLEVLIDEKHVKKND